MRKFLILSLAFTTIFISCEKDVDLTPINPPITPPVSCDFINFKYYNNSQAYLGELSNDYILIACDSAYSDNEIGSLISSVNYFDQDYIYTIHSHHNYKYKLIPLKFNTPKSCEEITEIIADLQEIPAIAYAHYTLQTDNCNNLIWEPMGDLCVRSYSSAFYVKVFDANDLTDLNNMISSTGTELISQNQFMEKWFVLRATKSSDGDALKMANYFHESGLFEHGEPDMIKYPVVY